MAIPVDEVCARILHFAESFLAPKPVDEVPSCAPQLLGPLLDLLEDLDVEKPHRSGSPSQVLCLMGCAPSLDSVYARRFLQIFLPPLRRMLYLHGPHRLAKGAQELQRSLLAHLHVLQRSCNHFASSSVPLVDLAPDLLQMFQDQEQIILPIDVAPGAPLMRLTRASEVVHLLSTKTKPKKLSFEAQDGTWHSFLLKGSDDLRLDGRIMQLLQMANAVVEAGACKALEALGPTCGTRGLRCRGYDVVPIAARAGLIRWVAAVPLFVIHKQRRQVNADGAAASTRRHQALASADLWHRKIQQHLRAMDSDVNHPRRHWPMEALRRTFDEMQADSPSDLISRELFLSSLHPGQHFLRQRAYTLSTSFSSILGHLIGLGDRHLDNLLLDLTTGEVVHVDYSICFDRGQRLRVPERVPFRLTRCMVHALGPLGLGGPFVQTMEVGLGLIAEWRELILSLMDCLARGSRTGALNWLNLSRDHHRGGPHVQLDRYQVLFRFAVWSVATVFACPKSHRVFNGKCQMDPGFVISYVSLCGCIFIGTPWPNGLWSIFLLPGRQTGRSP
ncbi:Serine/threonine-protein kinase Smg1 [Durusdinium trenchii]|uniref:Serine/threonine-protein kinase Smg1 n=1 Tax=Durusdinium trenchii TaxID=1381693 RepID=A0ABP0L3I1_9DINO